MSETLTNEGRFRCLAYMTFTGVSILCAFYKRSFLFLSFSTEFVTNLLILNTRLHTKLFERIPESFAETVRNKHTEEISERSLKFLSCFSTKLKLR